MFRTSSIVDPGNGGKGFWKKHHHGAGVNQHLNDPDEIGVERHEERCETQK